MKFGSQSQSFIVKNLLTKLLLVYPNFLVVIFKNITIYLMNLLFLCISNIRYTLFGLSGTTNCKMCTCEVEGKKVRGI